MKFTAKDLKDNISVAFCLASALVIVLACTLTLNVYGQKEVDDFYAKGEKTPLLTLYVVFNWLLNALLLLLLLLCFLIGFINLSRLVYLRAIEAAKEEIITSGEHTQINTSDEQV